MPKESAKALHIRPARIADSAPIARLATELGYLTTTSEMASRLAVLLPLPNHFIAVAEDLGTLLGWVAVEKRLLLVSGEKAELMGLVVGSARRRKGVGEALILAAEHWAIAQGFDAIIVRSNIARAESHPFYEDVGYIRTKTQHVYVKNLSSV